MAEPKVKPVKREAGKSKFRLPERAPRPVEESPLRALLKEAREQEQEALRPKKSPGLTAPAKNIRGGRKSPEEQTEYTPAIQNAGALPAATVSPEHAQAHSFAEFSRRWSPILRSGQMGVCRALFEMTYEKGRDECFTSMPKLAEAAGIKERQCYNVVGQLELLGFIERPDIFNTPTQKGTVFKLHVEPRPPSARSERRYHIGGDDRS